MSRATGYESRIVPSDCPFEESPSFAGLSFTGRFASYTDADSWYFSWADDDLLYSPYMDGTVDDESGRPISHDESGLAVIEGSDPLALEVRPVASASEEALRPFVYEGRSIMGCMVNIGKPPFMLRGNAYTGIYSCATIVHDGVWYLGAETRDGATALGADGNFHNWPFSGPFFGFRVSRDGGRSWSDPKPIETEPNPFYVSYRTLFPEPAHYHGQVRFASPHFADFGRNMMHSPDGKAYLLSNGSNRPGTQAFGTNTWDVGDALYLARVPLDPETINNLDTWEFFTGYGPPRGTIPHWSSNFFDLKPLFTWPSRIGSSGITYNEPLRKYFLTIGCSPVPGMGCMDTYLLEADELVGPWRLVTYLSRFGPQAYMPTIPSKFISDDGRTMWLAYSANYYGEGLRAQANPPGSAYKLCLAEVQLVESD